MKDTPRIFLVQAESSSLIAKKIPLETEIITLDDLTIKNERFYDVIVFVENDLNYIDTIKQCLLTNPGITFILYYQEPLDISTLVEFVKNGVHESVSIEDDKQICELVTRFAQKSEESQINYFNNLIAKFRELGIISNSMKMAEIFSTIEKVAGSKSTVLIYGESGTGKELVARSIHQLSDRRNNHYVGVNTGAIPENLLEDELFGHVKGSFTSAIKDRKGKFEYAHQGTIFLDEISNAPQSLQVKFLRVLQERVIERIGDNQPIEVDVRVIAATNQDMKKLVDQNNFREDLYYRLNVIPINLPPLRERRSDIPPLANYFVLKYCTINNLQMRSFSMPALRILKGFSWPGNVRQLENIVERMVVLNPDVNIFLPKDIPDEVKAEGPEDQNTDFIPEEIPEDGLSLSDFVKDVEKKLILKSLEKTAWNKQQAAKLLKIKRTTLIEKIKKIQNE